jgi:hypothetical protein
VHTILACSALLFAQVLTAQVTVGPERPVSTPDLQPAAFFQGNAAVASDGSGWLTTWVSGPSDNSGVSFLAAARMDGSGNVVDATPIVVSTSSVVGSAVAFGIDRYLIA